MHRNDRNDPQRAQDGDREPERRYDEDSWSGGSAQSGNGTLSTRGH